MDNEILKKVIEFLLKYANPTVGIFASLTLEIVKRILEKFIPLASEIKKIVYPMCAIGLGIGYAYLLSAIQIIPIANALICGGATGILIALGYAWITKTESPNP